jgi:hypothetical protein
MIKKCKNEHAILKWNKTCTRCFRTFLHCIQIWIYQLSPNTCGFMWEQVRIESLTNWRKSSTTALHSLHIRISGFISPYYIAKFEMKVKTCANGPKSYVFTVDIRFFTRERSSKGLLFTLLFFFFLFLLLG